MVVEEGFWGLEVLWGFFLSYLFKLSLLNVNCMGLEEIIDNGFIIGVLIFLDLKRLFGEGFVIWIISGYVFFIVLLYFMMVSRLCEEFLCWISLYIFLDFKVDEVNCLLYLLWIIFDDFVFGLKRDFFVFWWCR